MNYLFKNVDILVKENGEYKTIKNGYLGVQDEYIDYIGTEKPSKKYEVEKDYSNKLIMPGLINDHSHNAMVLFRGIGSGKSLQDWLFNYIFPLEAKLTPEVIYIATKYALLESLASGITSFSDMYFFCKDESRAIIEAGVKANLCKCMTIFDDDTPLTDPFYTYTFELFDEYHNASNGKLKIDFSVHAEYTNRPHNVETYSKICKEKGARMHIHLSETKKEVDECIQKYGISPVKWFENLKTFENPTRAAHCVCLSDEDIDILKKHNVTVAHNPTSNMMLGSGFAQIRKLLDKGVNVTLGTDGVASNNNMNMFEEMHIASIIHKGYNLDPTIITASEILDMATINGAKSQGRDDTGIIEVGKKADIIALNMDKPHLYPNFDTPTIIVTSAQASDVCLNMIDGQIMYEDGKYFTLDKEAIEKEFKKTIEEYYK